MMERIKKIFSLLAVFAVSILMVGNVNAAEYETHTALEQQNKLGNGGYFTFKTSTGKEGTSPQVKPGSTTILGDVIVTDEGESITFTVHPAEGYEVYEIAVNGRSEKPDANGQYVMSAADIKERNTHELTEQEAADLNELLIGGDPVSAGDILGAFFCPKFRPIGTTTNPDTGDGTTAIALVGLAAASLGTIIFVSNKKQTI